MRISGESGENNLGLPLTSNQVKKSYMIPYAITISYGLFSYSNYSYNVKAILRDLTMAMTSVNPDINYGNMTDYLSPHFIPFFIGVLFSAIGSLKKKYKSMVFTGIMFTGVIMLLIEYAAGFSWSIGIILINFAGGFFDGIAAAYRTFTLVLLSVRSFTKRVFCCSWNNRILSGNL